MLRRGKGAGNGRHARPGFFDWQGPVRTHRVTESATFTSPLFYYDAEAFEAFFTAPVDRVQRYLPSPNLFPVRLSSDRAMVGIGALRYRHFAWRTPEGPFVFGTPYGEIAVLLLCTHGRPAPRILPLLELSERETMHFFGYVLYLPVTSLESRVGGRVLANFPKFVADMAFEEGAARRSVRLEEAGRHIFTVSVKRGGVHFTDDNPMRLLTDMDDRLAKTVVPVRGRAAMRLMGSPAELELGDHEIANVLRDLELSSEGVASRDYEGMQLMLPAADKLDEPAHRVVDYVGRDLELGRFTITYEPGAIVDLYAPKAAEPFAEAATEHEPAPFVSAESAEGFTPEARV